MDRPVRYGILGAGRMGGMTMLKIMAGHPAAKAVAFYEIDDSHAETAERVAQLEQHGIERCASVEALLSRDDVDVILNVTPHYAHAELSIAALRAGHTVLCEKPPACSAGECHAMVEASRQTGNRLLIHFQHLLRPSARWLNQAVCAGELGAIRRVRCVSLWWRAPEYYTRVPWAGKRAYQGKPTLDGTMTNQTIHYINQMLALADRRGESHVSTPLTMEASLYRFHESVLEMEDTVVARGVLDNSDRTEFLFAGTTCAADAEGKSRLNEYMGGTERHVVTLEGERGTATWDGKARIEIPGCPARVYDKPEGPWPFYFHVREVLAGRERPVTPVAQSVHAMDFIFEAYRVGGAIQDRPWDSHETVSDVLGQCARDFCLPAELDRPPEWA